MPISKRLYRSREDRIVAGVFGGLGEYYEIDPVVLRLAFIVVLVVTVFLPGILIYILAIFVIPLQPQVHAEYEQQGTTKDTTKEDISQNNSSSPAPEASVDGKREKQPSADSLVTPQQTILIPQSRRNDPLW